MGIDGHNHLTILGPSNTLDIIENGGIVLSDEEITGDKDLIYFKNNYFTESWASCRMVRQKPTKKDDGKVTSNKLEIHFLYRNNTVDEYLGYLLDKYPDCWFKNEYYTEYGDCGLWLGEMNENGEKNIQTRYWFENCEEYYRG